MSKDLQFYQKVEELIIQQIDFVMVTVTQMQGSAPQEPGAKMLVKAGSMNSPCIGTIGGGKLELFAVKHARELLNSKGFENTESMQLNLQSDVGMTCGGVVQLFFEVYQFNTWHIAVFGAGHVAQALIPLLLTLNCKVHCIDDRTDWLDKLADHSQLHKISDSNLSQIINQLAKDSFIVSVTQGHCEDVKIIDQILRDRQPPYIGVIGSDSKAVILRKELSALGVDKKIIDQIHCPIGLKLGADTPAEIAVSICAQLLAVRDTI